MLKKLRKLKNSEIPNPTKNNPKRFAYKNYMIDYSNQCKIDNIEKEQTPKQISISNAVYQKVGDTFKKKTEIQFGKSKVVIQQNFQFNKQCKKTRSTVVKTQLIQQIQSDKSNFKDDSYRENDDFVEQYRQNRKDKKNVVKNIVKSFLSWIKSQTLKQNPLQSVVRAHQSLQKLIKQIKFNNNLITQIVRNQIHRKLFLEYLTNFGKQSIYASRINDKQTHIQSIQLYIKECNEQMMNDKQNQKKEN